MNRDNKHPILEEPPVTHGLDRWNPETGTLSYEYNGRNIINICIQGTLTPGYRMTSDVCMQSYPMIQQIFVELETHETASVTFRLSGDAVNMKPFRAKAEQAIIGQMCRPLMYGVNGLYDIQQDLFMAWFGADWLWVDMELIEADNSDLTARLEVGLGPKAWLINIYPQFYRTHLGYKNHKPWVWRPKLGPVAGWCSWEAFRRNVNRKAVGECCDFFEKKLKNYGLEYMQIDDGYEKTPVPHKADSPLYESWLETDSEKFPDGHGGIVDLVKEKGFKPGIWTHSSIMNEDFARQHEYCILKDNKGDLLEGDWAKYIFDCNKENISRHVLPIYQGLREAGYDYVKVDALRHLLYDGLHEAVRQGVLTNDEAEARYRDYLQAIREGLGDEVFFLACWGTITQTAGIADACRIAQDSNPTWPGVRMQLVESARWYHTQRILFINDPDHICARTKIEWLKSLASLVSLSGGMYMLSDALNDYDDERIDIIRKSLPPLSTMTAETGPIDFNYPAYTWTKLHGFFVVNNASPTGTEEISIDDAMNMAGNYETMDNDHPFSSLWAFHLVSNTEKWCVAARFATVPLRGSTINTEKLSLDPKQKYIAFDFWQQEFLGIIKGEINVKPLELGCCQIIGLRPILGRPQFIGSSRHVSMDAVSLKSQMWHNRDLTLEIEGVPGSEEDYWIHIPEGFDLKKIESDNAEFAIFEENDILRIRLKFKKENNKLNLKF